MAFEGTHYALSLEQRRFLVELHDDKARRVYVEDGIAPDQLPEFMVELEQAWDAIHRCLTGQPAALADLDEEAGERPLNLCIMGGRTFHDGGEFVIKFIESHEVAAIARALAALGETDLRELYHAHCKDAFDGYGDDDCAYTWQHFAAMKQFFKHAAGKNLAVIFTADQ
jgi:hypothetical protein